MHHKSETDSNRNGLWLVLFLQAADTGNGKDWGIYFIHNGLDFLFNFPNLCIQFRNEFYGVF